MLTLNIRYTPEELKELQMKEAKQQILKGLLYTQLSDDQIQIVVYNNVNLSVNPENLLEAFCDIKSWDIINPTHADPDNFVFQLMTQTVAEFLDISVEDTKNLIEQSVQNAINKFNKTLDDSQE